MYGDVQWQINLIGFLYQNAKNIYYDLYKKHLDIKTFVFIYMTSKIREAAEEGNPRFIFTNSENIMKELVQNDLGNDESKIMSETRDDRYDWCDLYWVGGAYVYISHITSTPFFELIRIIPFDDMCRFSVFGHQLVAYSSFYDRIKEDYFAVTEK